MSPTTGVTIKGFALPSTRPAVGVQRVLSAHTHTQNKKNEAHVCWSRRRVLTSSRTPEISSPTVVSWGYTLETSILGKCWPVLKRVILVSTLDEWSGSAVRKPFRGRELKIVEVLIQEHVSIIVQLNHSVVRYIVGVCQVVGTLLLFAATLDSAVRTCPFNRKSSLLDRVRRERNNSPTTPIPDVMCHEPKFELYWSQNTAPQPGVLSLTSHSHSHGRFMCLYRRLWLWFSRRSHVHITIEPLFLRVEKHCNLKNYCVGSLSVSDSIHGHEIVFSNVVSVLLRTLTFIIIQLTQSAVLVVADWSVFRCISYGGPPACLN